MDLGALFKISHGMYLTGAVASDGRLVGSCVDSVMVVEAGPCQVMISMNNFSYTREVVLKTGRLALSVLPMTEEKTVIKRFGTQSSRTIDKWTETPHHLIQDLPVYDACVSAIILKVISHQATPHHMVFLCEVVDTLAGTMAEPMTYAYYQQVIQPQKKE